MTDDFLIRSSIDALKPISGIEPKKKPMVTNLRKAFRSERF
jgi:hypothetical protein